jgi:intracellular multiplication protein IcmP
MAAQQQQSNQDSSMAPVWIMALVFIAVFFVWKLGHQHIVSFVFFVSVWQGKMVNLILNNPALANQIYLMQTIDPATVEFSQLLELARSVGDYMRYPVVLALGLLAFYLYRTNIKLKYRRAHDMKSLRSQEQFNWPAIMPIVKEDLAKQDINVGPWAMALTPYEFCKKHNLLKKNDVLLDNPLPGQEMTAGVRKGDAKRVFTMQLGPYWDGFEHLSPQAFALAGVFMARMNRDRDAGNEILKELDKTFVAGKPNFAIAKPTVAKYKDSELVQEVVNKHAYALTVMISLLAGARNDGVVPSSEFLWLKVVDRRLWYTLNCVGRQTPYPEVAGPFAHWRAEKELGRRSLVPMIDEAIKGLEVAMREIKLTPRQMQELEP